MSCDKLIRRHRHGKTKLLSLAVLVLQTPSQSQSPDLSNDMNDYIYP